MQGLPIPKVPSNAVNVTAEIGMITNYTTGTFPISVVIGNDSILYCNPTLTGNYLIEASFVYVCE